jgi:hypothetical protein
MGLQVINKCFENVPERFLNVNDATFMWDVPDITDRKILANRPYIVR